MDAASRLTELRAEAEAGYRQLAELDARRVALRDTLLRIDGAITVLEELVAAGNGHAAPEVAR